MTATIIPGWLRTRASLRAGLRAATFVAVEAGVAVCIHRQITDLGAAPLAGRLLVLAFIVVWGFEAQSRFAFRGRRPRGDWLSAMLRYSAFAWGCLCLQALARGWAEVAALASWLGLSAARFGLAEAFVWGPPGAAESAHHA